MGQAVRLESAEIYQTAFRSAPELVAERGHTPEVGIYSWKTPHLDGFELPETDALIIALHLGGSRRVRAITNRGLSRSCSVPGLVTVLPPGQPAAFRTEGGISLVTLHVPKMPGDGDQAEFQGWRANPGLSPNFAFRDPFLYVGMESLLRAAQLGSRLHPDYLPKISESLICHLSRWNVQDQPAASPVVSRSDRRLGSTSLDELLAYIERELGTKLCLDELARSAGLCRAAFTRAFKQAIGFSPHQYLSLRRVEAAKRLMRDTDLDLVFIAQETGFSSQSHFTEVFRGLVGCTPARFRQLH